MQLLAHPRQEHQRPGVRSRLPRRGRRSHTLARPGGRADHRGPGVVDPRTGRAVEGGALRGVSHRTEKCEVHRELCVAAFPGASRSSVSILEAGLIRTTATVQWSRDHGLLWAEGFASTIDGIVHAVAGDVETAQRGTPARSRSSSGSATRKEPACRSAASPARWRSRRPGRRLELYRRSLAAFEAIGDRAEEARILSETAWTHLRNEDPALARRYFLDSVQAYTELASVRGVGLSLIGLAATEAVERGPRRPSDRRRGGGVRPAGGDRQRLLRRDAGREYVDQARAALSADEVARAAEAGRRLTIKEALDLARLPQTAAV